MTEKLYEVDSYVQNFTAQVVSCAPVPGGFAVVLDRTAFFPEGGGQPADRGTLTLADGTVLHVTDVHETGGVIWHTVNALPEAAQPGTAVTGAIDWAWRFDKMQQHTGEHILSGILHQMFGAENVGFHIGSDAVRMDTSVPISAEGLREAETAANRVIWEDVPVVITYPTPEEPETLDYRSKTALTGQVRIVTFPGADVCACCGTHVRRAGEIGVIKILSLMNHRGGVRLELLCGKAALAYMDGVMENNGEIARLLSVKPRQTAEAVRKEMAAATEERQKLADMSRNYFRLRAAMLPREGIAVDFEEDLSPWALRKGAETLLEEGGAPVYVLLSGGDGCFRYVIASGKGGARALGQALNKRLRGRGGGSDELVQGQFSAAREEIEAALRETLAEAGL